MRASTEACRVGWDEVGTALERSITALVGAQRADGALEGFLEGGVLFNAAVILLQRAPRARPPVVDERGEIELARYLASCEDVSGLFQAYPGGPPSQEATRIALLALERVLQENSRLREGPDRSALTGVVARAKTALQRPPQSTRELLFQRLFRVLLEVVDAGHEPRPLPDLRALLVPPSPAAPLVTGPRARLDGFLFPFITVLAPFVVLLGMQARSRSRVGALIRRLGRGWLPGRLERHGVRRLAQFLIDHQDDSGGFFYSAVYSALLITALEGLAPGELSPELARAAELAVDRARGYLSLQQVPTPRGTVVNLLGSDLWDSTSLGVSILSGRTPLLPPSSLHALTRFVLECQMPDGGWSFGRRSAFTDSDTTGWSIAFIAQVRRRGLCPELDGRIAEAVAAGFDLMARQVSPSGGFGAWGKNGLWKRRGTVGELESVLLDLPAEEVTGRALLAFGELQALYEQDAAFGRTFGIDRHDTLLRLRDGAVRFLRAQRNPDTGLWPARWALGFLPGTAFVLSGLRRHTSPEVIAWREHAARTVLPHQNADGGFGESRDTDERDRYLPAPVSTVVHTASALGILHTAGYKRHHPVYRRAVRYLLDQQRPDGTWGDAAVYTCFTGFYYRYDLMSHAAATAALAQQEELDDLPPS